METKEFAENMCKFLSDKKAQDIVKIYVADKTIIADYFIIASGRSTTQVKSLCANLTEYAESLGVEVKRSEGVSEGRWAVVDFGDVIVHVFNDEQRLFYHLEKIWGDGEKFEEQA